MWYVNSEGDAFNLIDAQSIVKSDTDSRIFAVYPIDENSLEIESIDDSYIAKIFILWLVRKIARDETLCTYADFEEQVDTGSTKVKEAQ
jgi:hypothetical protein